MHHVRTLELERNDDRGALFEKVPGRGGDRPFLPKSPKAGGVEAIIVR